MDQWMDAMRICRRNRIYGTSRFNVGSLLTLHLVSVYFLNLTVCLVAARLELWPRS